jgi:hypothetical protein
MSYTPPSLTRFYGTPRFGLDVLDNRQVSFVRVTLLNDPFDPYGFFETEFYGYLGLFKYVQHKHPRDLWWFRASVTSRSWHKTEEEIKDYMADLRLHSFVLSMSAPTAEAHPRDSAHMWGHYGGGHRGLAIEFDPANLETAIIDHNSSVGGEPLNERDKTWIKMEYADSFAPIMAEDVFQFLKQENDSHAQKA